MKLKKQLGAVILCGLVLLCSCGNIETTSDDGSRLTREAEQSMQIYTETTLEKETPFDINSVIPSVFVEKTPDEKAQLVREKALKLVEDISKNGTWCNYNYYIGKLDGGVDEIPDFGDTVSADEFEKALNFYVNGEIDGYYAISFRPMGYPTLAMWSDSMNSADKGSYPPENESIYWSDKTFSEMSKSITEITYLQYSHDKLLSLSYPARNLFANAQRYTENVKNAGATIDSLAFYGSFNEKVNDYTSIENGETLTSNDVINAMSYYWGDEEGGYFALLLDEQYNPIAVLWAEDETTNFIGAFPNQSASREFLENGDTIKTADITKAIYD
jgi:hypothetical protein